MSRTIVSYILDESGSMEVCQDAAISGFNEYLANLRRGPEAAETFLSLTKFNSTCTVVCVAEPVARVRELTRENYIPNDMTALYDAIGETLDALEPMVEGDDRVLVVIMTDGEENSSRKSTLDQIRQRITDKERNAAWTFAYMGANQDAWAVGATLGVAGGNTLTYQSSPDGTAAAMQTLSRATTSYRRAALRRTDKLFEGEAE